MLPTLASAQPGEHIRAGEAVITPKVSVGVEHSTNAYRSEDVERAGTNLRFAPGLEVGASGEDLEFAFSGEYELRKYFQPELTNLDRFNDFQLGADLAVAKNRAIGFKLDETMGLRNYPAESPFADRPFETQFRNDLLGGVAIRPGAIEAQIGGRWAFDDFQVVGSTADTGGRSFNRKNTFGPAGELEWKFFPRTSVVLQGSYEFIRWQDNLIEGVAADVGSEFGSTLAIPDATNLRLLTGLQGRVTEKLLVVVLAGYGSAVYDENSVGAGADGDPAQFGADLTGLDRLLVDVQGRFDFGEDDRFVLGYQRNFRDVFFTNFVAYDYGFGRIETRFNPRFGFAGELGARAEDYEGEIARQDMFFSGRGDLAYYLQDWATVSGGVWYTQRASTDDQVAYDDFNIHLMTNIVY